MRRWLGGLACVVVTGAFGPFACGGTDDSVFSSTLPDAGDAAGAGGSAGDASAGTGGAGATAGTGGAGATGGTGGSAGTGGAAGAAGTGGAGASCGNGTVDLGEQCDLGAANDDHASGACPGVCRTACVCPYCGDGVTDFARGEECDDKNLQPNDGCSSNCEIEAASTCGNGVVDFPNGEECDDGGVLDGDGCDASCQLEPVGQSCGDGSTGSLEKCDDSNTTNGDACNPTCNLLNRVTTIGNVTGTSLTTDDRYLWIGDCAQCRIRRIDIDACLNNNQCAPQVVAGNGCGTAPQDGTGTGAVLTCVETMTTDGTTVWFGNQHTIRELDIASSVVTTVAGKATSCAAIDGTGTASALFHDIRGLAHHRGQVYLLDGCENVLRRFDPQSRVVTTLAGQRYPDPAVTQSGAYSCPGSFSCVSPAPADGLGTAAVFGSPRYMTADGAGNLFITDTNGVSMRSYNLVTGWVGTLIGGSGYQDGVGSAVRVSRPRGVTSDGTSLYFNEQTAHTVRQVIIQSAATSTLTGVRGCPGSRNGTGGDGTQDWSIAGCGTANASWAQIDTPLGGITFHYRTRSIFLLESGRLRRIE